MKKLYLSVGLCFFAALLFIGILFFPFQEKDSTNSNREQQNTADERGSSSNTLPSSGQSSSQQPDSSKNTETAQDFTLEEKLLFIETGDSYQISVSNLFSKAMEKITWNSDQSSVASINSQGNVKAKKNGTAVIQACLGDIKKEVYVNVISPTEYTGNSCDFSLLTEDGKKRTYRLFKQNAHNYSKYDKFIAWHGCATCSLATVLGAFHSSYEGVTPDKIIDGPEKTVANASDWNREHKKRSLKNQMPISLFGISSILSHYNVENTYVRTYEEDTAQEDITKQLQSGRPVIFEVRQKSNKTGKKSNRWTNSYHTMILLGILTNGNVLLCDSIDRSWYDGGQRLKIVALSDVMEYMFPCTKFSESIYYDGADSDGGYIKINE